MRNITLDSVCDFKNLFCEEFSEAACEVIWSYLVDLERDDQEIDPEYYTVISDNEVEDYSTSWKEYKSLYKYLEEHNIDQKFASSVLDELNDNFTVLPFEEGGETVFDNFRLGFVISTF